MYGSDNPGWFDPLQTAGSLANEMSGPEHVERGDASFVRRSMVRRNKIADSLPFPEQSNVTPERVPCIHVLGSGFRHHKGQVWGGNVSFAARMGFTSLLADLAALCAD